MNKDNIDEQEVKHIVDKVLDEEPSLIDKYLYPEKELLKKVYQDIVLKGKIQFRTRRAIFEHYEEDKE